MALKIASARPNPLTNLTKSKPKSQTGLSTTNHMGFSIPFIPTMCLWHKDKVNHQQSNNGRSVGVFAPLHGANPSSGHLYLQDYHPKRRGV